MSEQKKLLDTLRIDRDAPLEKGAFPVLRTTGIALLVAVVGLIAYWAGSTGSDHSGAAPASSVVATPAGTLVPAPPSPASAAAPNDSVLSASGYITARRMATVASRITGQLTEVVVEEGMRVAAGDVLARLDDKIARNELDRAQAESRAALARVESGKAGLAEADKEFFDAEAATIAAEEARDAQKKAGSRQAAQIVAQGLKKQVMDVIAQRAADNAAEEARAAAVKADAARQAQEELEAIARKAEAAAEGKRKFAADNAAERAARAASADEGAALDAVVKSQVAEHDKKTAIIASVLARQRAEAEAKAEVITGLVRIRFVFCAVCVE